uniref:Immunity related GTPase M n=1 Tax=Aotus nancymaae TaxID=37293 RepID=A0A2K5DS67_AOTNA
MNVERASADGDLPEVVSAIKETLKIVFRTPVNIAMAGDSGNSMSTFISALQNTGHEGKASPPTGLVKATQRYASYFSSHFPNVVLWDLPGAGSFSQHDFIMGASAQFSMNHVILAKTIEDMGKKFYIVWTKLDMDLSTGALPEVQENVPENLQREQVCEPPIFMASSLEPLLHDFPKLRDTLQKTHPN